MTIYISGAMSGIPQYNAPAFKQAQQQIKRLAKRCPQIKFRIINPVNIGASMRAAFAKKDKGEPEWADYMRGCIKKLSDADAAFFLPDWVQSKGASLERHIASRLGISCADNMEALKKIIKDFAKVNSLESSERGK